MNKHTKNTLKYFWAENKPLHQTVYPACKGKQKATLSLQFRFAIHLRGKTKIIEHIRRSIEQDIIHVFFYSLEPLSLFRLADVDDEPSRDVSSLPEPLLTVGGGN